MDKPRLKFWQIWNMSSLSWGVLRRTPQTPPSLPGVNPARSGPYSPWEIA